MPISSCKFIDIPQDELIDLIFHLRKERDRRKKLIDLSKTDNFSLIPVKNKTFQDAFLINSLELRSLIGISKPLSIRSKYYKALISQDWSHIYPRKTEFGDHYVYAHLDPSRAHFGAGKGFGGLYAGTPFYIGKGIGDRAYDLKRNQGHGREVRQLLDLGYTSDQIVKIVFDGLSENRAYELEAKLIYFFGTVYQKYRSKSTLLNLDIPKIPDYKMEMVAADKHIKISDIWDLLPSKTLASQLDRDFY